MKLKFPIPSDGKMHRYCISCHTEGAVQVQEDGHTYYHCHSCGKRNDRALYFNTHIAWLDENNELWHESCGVFVRRPDGKFLFYKRTEFPRKLTVPAGHVDNDEDAHSAAKRELQEETGVNGDVVHIGDADIVGDSCSAGADAHRWHAYLLMLEGNNWQDVNILDEGEEALWLTLDQAKEQGMAFVIEKISMMFREHVEI